jgi:hypothetical protein
MALLFGAACTSSGAPPLGGVAQADVADGAAAPSNHGYAVFTSVATDPKPTGRAWTSFAYDSGRAVSVLYGGSALIDVLGDTWEYDGAWKEVNPGDNDAPGGRGSAAMAYAPGRGVSVLFGGFRSPSALCETWEWTGSTAKWRLASQPSCTDGESVAARRIAHAMTDVGDDVALFGGKVQNSGAFQRSNALLRWDGSTWSSLCDAACQSGSAALPAPRAYPAFVHVKKGARDVLWLFGGTTDTSVVNDLWQFDPTTVRWSQLCTSTACRASAPDARTNAGAAYDSVRNRVVLHGGCASDDCTTQTFHDVYEYDPENDVWAKAPTSLDPTFPDAKGAFGIVFDAKRGRVVEFGGFAAASYGNRTVEYSTRGGACTADADCDTGTCVKSAPTDGAGVCAAACTGTVAAPAFCAGGYLCNAACNAPCQTCAAVPGVCTAITNGPDDEASDAPASRCSGTSACVAGGTGNAGACKLVAGQKCNSGADCGTGNCARYGSQVCADPACGDKPCRPASTAGTCTVLGAGHFVDECMGRSCGANGDCLDQCASDDDCDPDYYCDTDDTHDCKRGKRYGGACKSSQECGKGVCFDGVCCDQPCGDSCQACGKDGRCTTLPAGSDPVTGHTACVGAGGGTCGGYCDGVAAACTYPDGMSCGGGACVEDDWRASSVCVHGACAAGDAPTSCGAYSCASGKCNTSCSSDDQCRRGAVCDVSSGTGICNDQGTTCSTDGAGVLTASGTIVSCDGYLCQNGACAFKPCSADGDCASGYACTTDHRCVEGTRNDAGAAPTRDGGAPITPVGDAGTSNADAGAAGSDTVESGCSVTAPGRRDPGSVVLLGVAVALWFGRRRRTAA